MQPHDAANAAEDVPVPQIRITPEELTSALAALEARKQEEALRREEEARYLAKTIPIGQAVSDLNLDSTPEEIWTEVQAQRTAAITPPAVETWQEDETVSSELFYSHQLYQEARREHQPPFFWKGFAAFAVLALGIPVFMGLMNMTSSEPSPPWSTSNQTGTTPPGSFVTSQGINPFNRIARTIDDDFYRKLRLCQGANPTYNLMHVDVWPPNRDGSQPDETVYPVRAVPDGYSIFNDRVTGYPENDSSSQGGVVFCDSSDPIFTSAQGCHIITTRYDGDRYVRCWIDRNDVDALKHRRSVALYFCRTGPGIPTQTKLMPITIRLSRNERGQQMTNFWLRGAILTTDAPNRFIVPEGQSIALDGHARENFPGMSLPAYVPPDWAKMPGVFNDTPGFPPGPSDFQMTQEYRGFDASSSLEDVAAVPNNQLFHGDIETVLKLAGQPVPGIYGNAPAPEKLVDVRPHLDRPYTFVKHNGYVYLRGWTAERLTGSQLQGHVISVASDADAPSFIHPPVQTQLRLDICNVSISAITGMSPYGPYSSGGYSVIASNIHLDKHAWEKW